MKVQKSTPTTGTSASNLDGVESGDGRGAMNDEPESGEVGEPSFARSSSERCAVPSTVEICEPDDCDECLRCGCCVSEMEPEVDGFLRASL